MKKILDYMDYALLVLAIVITIAQAVNGSFIGCMGFACIAYILYKNITLEQ